MGASITSRLTTIARLPLMDDLSTLCIIDEMHVFVERIEELSEDELLDELETDGVWLAENVHFVDDAESGEIIHQW